MCRRFLSIYKAIQQFLVNEWCDFTHAAVVALHIVAIRVRCTQKLLISEKFLSIDVTPAWYICILSEWKGAPRRTLRRHTG